MIFKIAKTELRNLFYSPVAWFLTIVFFVQCAVFYTTALQPFAKQQDLLINNNPKFENMGFSLTAGIFLSTDSIFMNVLQNLYLFVPLLTMGLISREINNGTIKLLYSSPVRTPQIVLGKYLAIMLYNLLLVAIVGIFVVTAAFNIKAMDYGMLLSAMLGFYLLVCAYTSIGLFMSSLTTYQIVSAIGSFIVIFILIRIGTLWQKYDFVRDLTYFLSLSGRTANMLRGLITSKDVFYFLTIVYIFLGFTLIKMQAVRNTRPWYVHASRYLLIFCTALMFGYISSRSIFVAYWDVTASQRNTLHPNSQKIIKELGDDPLEVTMYTNLMGPGLRQGLPEARNNYLKGLWEPYVRFKPDIKFKYEYYYAIFKNDSTVYKQFPGKNLAQIAEQLGGLFDTDVSSYLSPEAQKKKLDLEPENLRLVMQLKYKGRTTFLRTFDDPAFWPIETQVDAAFKRLIGDKLPKIYYLTGNLERSILKFGEREYYSHATSKSYRTSLINIGFDVDTLSLDRQEIPADASTLVLADPKTDLSSETLAKIKTYLDNGGNMLIIGEPGKQHVIKPVLDQLGVRMLAGALVQPTDYEMPQMVNNYLTSASGELAEDDMLLHLKHAAHEHNTGDTIRMMTPGVTGLAYETSGPYAVKPLMMNMSPTNTWQKKGTLVTDSAKVVYEPQNGDIKGTFPTALALSRPHGKAEQRIVVFSDADFISNIRIGGSSYFINSVYSWLNYNKFPIYTPYKKPVDNLLRITPIGVKILVVTYVWIVPILILIAGTILLIRRKRK